MSASDPTQTFNLVKLAPLSTMAASQTIFLLQTILVSLYRDNIMKTLKCDLCDHEAQGETFEEWMETLKPHYGEAHADVIKDSSKTKEDMKKWMTENKARFDAA